MKAPRRRPHAWKDYPLRVSRSDSAIPDRSRHVAVHAAAFVQNHEYRTACGLRLYAANEFDRIGDWTSCKNCRRVLGES